MPLEAGILPDSGYDFLLPADLDGLTAEATRILSREERLIEILKRRLSNPGLSLDAPPRLFSFLGPDSLLAELDEGMRIRVLRGRILDRLEDPFGDLGNGYRDDLFQGWRLARENARDADQKLIDDRTGGRAGGWRWDISSDVRLVLRGQQEITALWGFDSVDQNLQEGKYVKRVEVARDFRLAQNLDINLVGSIGPRISVNINHNTMRRENDYDIRYTGAKEEILKEIAAGTIDVSLPGSKYVVYSGGSKAAFGVKAALENDFFRMQAVLSLTKGVSETREFRGQRSEQKVLLRDTSWVKHRYFRIPDTGLDKNSFRLYLTTTVTNGSLLIAGGLYTVLVEGKDYIFNQSSGQLDLAKPVTRDQNLLALWTVGGSDTPGLSHPAPPWAAHERVQDLGRSFVYLKRVGYYSRFERKGIYLTGYRNIELSRGFELAVVTTADGVRSSEVQFQSDAWRLNPENGMLEFQALEPFDGKPGVPEILYHSQNDPEASDSVYSISMAFLHRVDSFQLRYNVMLGSERVYLNGAIQTRDREYRIDYTTGELVFLVALGESDTIRVSYEYKPYGNSLQRTLFGTRADIRPVDGLEFGTSLFYSGGQKPTGAPQPVATPDSQMILAQDARIDLMKLFGVKRPEWRVRIEAEAAYSVHDRNTVDRAIFADMEADVTGYAITRSEEKWWPGSPSRAVNGGLTQAGRGRLLYRDYRDYGLSGDYSLESYNWNLPSSQIYGYARKPGPYTAGGGRNESTSEISENSLVMEYDLSGGRTWVNAVCSIAGAGGLDLSRISQLLLSLRHQGVRGFDGNGNPLYGDVTGSPVTIHFEIGRLDEDADGDGVFDREETAGSGGWAFTPAGAESTWPGGGRKNAGNGVIDGEDLDGDGVLSTTEETVLFPAAGFTEPALASIPQGGGWQELTFRIENLSQSNLAILSRANAVRITITGAGGERGRLLIDRAWFKGSTWDVLRIDDTVVPDRTLPAFSASVISTRENSEYRDNRIFREYRDDFEDLHGTMSNTEESEFNEKALQLQWNLSNMPRDSGGTGSFGSVTRVYNTTLDFSFYRKMVLYMFVKEKAGDTNEAFVFRLGNSDDRYYQWRIPLTSLEKAGEAVSAGRKKWHKLEFDLDPGTTGDRFVVRKDGVILARATTSPKKPNLREVTRATVGVDTTGSLLPDNRGELWVNEGHLADDVTKSGTAFSLRGDIVSPDKPLVEIWGIPLVGPVSARFDLDAVTSGFRSIGQQGEDLASRMANTSARFSILGGLDMSLQYSDETRRSDTDEARTPLTLQHATTNRTWRHTIGWSVPKGYFPSLEHTYTRSVQRNVTHVIDSTTNLVETLADVLKKQYSESAGVTLGGRLPAGFTWKWLASDSLFISDSSRQTNGVAGSWYTNAATTATATWNRKESLSLIWGADNFLGINRSQAQVSLTTFAERERYDSTRSRDGMRDLIRTYDMMGPMEAWAERTASLLSGMGRIGDSVGGTNIGAIGEGMNYTAAFRNLGFLSLTASFSRSARDANFVRMLLPAGQTNYVHANNDTTTAKSQYGLVLAFPEFPLRSLSLDLSRDLSYSQTAGQMGESQIWRELDGVFMSQPFSGSDVLGLGSRHAALDDVSRLKDEGNSYLSISHRIALSLRLDYGETLFADFLPADWQLTETQNTARNLMSYVQNRQRSLSFNKNFPLKKLGFWLFDEASSPGKSVQDLALKMQIGRSWDYNTKQVSDTLAASLGFNVNWNRSTTMALAWEVTRSRTEQFLVAGDAGYEYMGLGADSGDGRGDSFGDLEELAGGKAPAITEVPGLTKWDHGIRFDIGFQTKHSGTLEIFRLKIPIDTEWKHMNEVLIRFSTSEYDRNREGRYNFSEIFERTFYLRLKHSIDYDFTSNWNGVLHLAFVFERWRLVLPSSDGFALNEDDFGLSFGFEVGLKMQIRF
ncbi:MAG TPA: hypothetical protein PK297_00435 [Spirochaetota bacterium]|nr:hypothetical protein [Spirochaetota bacterium]